MREYIDQGVRLGWLIDPKSGDGRDLPARPAGRGPRTAGDALRRGRAARVRARPEGHLVRLRPGGVTDGHDATEPGRPFTTRLGLALVGHADDPEEFDATPESAWVTARYRYELIHGVLVVTPPRRECRESTRTTTWAISSGPIRRHHPQRLGPRSTRLPEQTIPTTANRRRCRPGDLDRPGPAARRREGRPLDRRRVRLGRADATRPRDYEQKRDEYLAVGVREYWIIDRFRRIMTVYRERPDGPVAPGRRRRPRPTRPTCSPGSSCRSPGS